MFCFGQRLALGVLGVISICSTRISAQDPTMYFDGIDSSVYLEWVQAASYDKNTYIPTPEAGVGAAIHWSVDETNIHLAVAVKATGWAGFGLGEAGGMLGADIVMYTAATDELVDSYVLDQFVAPMKDECQSWNLTSSTVDGGFIIFEATRLLDTQDSQDRAIIDDTSTIILPTRVIAAWGDTDDPAYHGSNNRVRSSIRFYGAAAGEELAFFKEAMAVEAEASFELRAVDFEIPAVKTHYQVFCFSEADLIAMGVPTDSALHTVGFEPTVDTDTTQYVHHFILSASEQPFDSSSDCEEDFLGFEQAYVWAPGDLPVSFPSNIGSPLGSDGFRSFQLEIHYDNPSEDTGMMDSSGIKMYYTSVKRDLDLGIMQTGDPAVELSAQPVSTNGGLSQHVFECDAGCSTTYLDEPVTVLREHLHMHATGVSMTNEQIRNGQVVRQGTVEYWDFSQQGNIGVVQDSFEIQAGDAFRTTCNYKPNNGEVFGLGSEEEMCIAFLYYYPRKLAPTPFGFDWAYGCGIGFGDLVPNCEATWKESDLGNVETSSVMPSLSRTFGTAPESCNATPTPAPTAATTQATTDDSSSSSSDDTSPASTFSFTMLFAMTSLAAICV